MELKSKLKILWRRKWCRRTFILLIGLFILFGPIPFKGLYRGRVVDAVTGKPIVGAVVVVSWTAVSPNAGGGTTYGLDATEMLTDENGEFSFWGIGGLYYAFAAETHIGVYKVGYPSFDSLWWGYKRFASSSTAELARSKFGYFVHFKWGRAIVMLRPITTFEQFAKYGRPPRVYAAQKNGEPFLEHDKAEAEYHELYKSKYKLYKEMKNQ